MRLLLLRAAEDAARTRLTLEAAGHSVLVSPVLVFESTEESWPRRAPDGLIATSSRAFTATDATRADLREVPLYLVGRRTEAAARQHGLAGPAMVAADGAALLAILRARPAMRLLYLAGVDRKPDIEEGLEATAHRLIVVETYEAVAATSLAPEAIAAFRDGAVDAVLHYSRRSAEIFLALAAHAGVDPTGTRHVCLSSDVAIPLREHGCCQVQVAPMPDEGGMLSLIA
jgi:uroporphyrinogen-III synthase